MKKHQTILRSKNGNYLFTIAIGSKILREWKVYSMKNWVKYCRKNNLGLIIIISDLIEKNNIYWKKATWQKMLLGEYALKNIKQKIKNICFLDVDILINPNSPNIFKYHDPEKISVVSFFKNIPYEFYNTRKLISYYRNKYYSSRYKLNSIILSSPREMFKYANLKPFNDFFCAGLFIFNAKKFSNFFFDTFFKYKKDVKSMTGGDQTHLNYEVFKMNKVNFISYKFQALWIYEIANRYPFLYNLKGKKNLLLKECIEDCLDRNFFLHFAGSWFEGSMWKMKNIYGAEKSKSFIKKINYLKKKVKIKIFKKISQ